MINSILLCCGHLVCIDKAGAYILIKPNIHQYITAKSEFCAFLTFIAISNK